MIAAYQDWAFPYNQTMVQGNCAVLDHNCLSEPDLDKFMKLVAAEHNTNTWVFDLTTECCYYNINKQNIFEIITHMWEQTAGKWHLVTSDFNIKRIYQDWLDITNAPKVITVAQVPYFFRREYVIGQQPRDPILDTAPDRTPRFYSTFNNRFNGYSLKLMTALAEEQLADSGYWTWRYNSEHWQHLRNNSLFNCFSQYNLPYNIELNKGLAAQENHNTLRWVSNSHSHTALLRTYSHTEIDCVVECYEYNNNSYYNYGHDNRSRFFSEKTVRPLVYGQPFITVGSPHLLSALRSLGFKTFSTWWDESYDTASTIDQRVQLAVRSLKQAQANGFKKQQAAHVLEHNAELARKLGGKETLPQYVAELLK